VNRSPPECGEVRAPALTPLHSVVVDPQFVGCGAVRRICPLNTGTHIVLEGGLGCEFYRGGRGLFPDTRQGRPCVAGPHPDAGQRRGIARRGEDDVHDSSFCGSCRYTRIHKPGARTCRGSTNHRLGGCEERVFSNRRLTRSNHRSYAGMSGKEGVDSRATGGSQSAHSSTSKSPVRGGSGAESLLINGFDSPTGREIPASDCCTISP
jgi:hypothetical protein